VLQLNIKKVKRLSHKILLSYLNELSGLIYELPVMPRGKKQKSEIMYKSTKFKRIVIG